MKSNYTQIFLTLELRGESLARPGVYQSAKIQVNRGWTKDELMAIVEPMKVIEEPVYAKATKVTTLGQAFVDMALTKPTPPRDKNQFHRWLRSPEGRLYNDWNRLNDNQKVRVHLVEIAEAYNADIKTFALM